MFELMQINPRSITDIEVYENVISRGLLAFLQQQHLRVQRCNFIMHRSPEALIIVLLMSCDRSLTTGVHMTVLHCLTLWELHQLIPLNR